MNKSICIPSVMTCHRIDYSTEYKFDGPCKIVETTEEMKTLLSGFSFRHEDELKAYDSNFFSNCAVVAFLQHEGSGSIGHSLKCAEISDRKLSITIYREIPAIGTCDMASYLCLVSIPRDILPFTSVICINTINKEDEK